MENESYWPKLTGDAGLSPWEARVMSGRQQTRGSEIPDQIQTEVQELSATGASTIYELPAFDSNESGASAIYELSAFDSNESGSDFTGIATPSESEISTITSGDNLIDMSLQQQGGRDKKGDAEALVHISAVPESVSSSNVESRKTMKSSTKDSPKPDARKKSRTGGQTASDKIVVAVFGLTGTGKSSFISKLTGRDMEIGHGLQSCTSEIEEIPCKIGLSNVILLDTPGFDDTHRSDAEILKLIASYMKEAYLNKTRLTGIIYLHRISDIRMSGSSTKNLRMLRSLCGTDNLSHVSLVTTMWDKVQKEEGEKREEELLSIGKFWGDIKNDGAKVRRYNNTSEKALALVNELLQMSSFTLQIQKEIAVQRKALIDTDAGQSINEALTALTKKHEKQLAEIKEDIDQAIKENDAKWRRELEESQKQLAQKIKETEESKRTLRIPVNRRAWFQWSWRCKGCDARLTVKRGQDPKGECPGCGFVQNFL